MTRPDLLRPWSAAEDRTLRTAYAEGGIAAATAALPNRSRTGIYRRAQRLEIKRRRRWSRQDDNRLRMLWGEASMDAIVRELGRTRLTVYWRAQHLGLELGCPQGWEYLTAAAQRTGYSTGQLRRILRAAHVRIEPGYSRTQAPKQRHYHIVQPHDVDEAVAAWHATETVHDAACRRGMCSETLRQWLLDAGCTPPKRRGPKPARPTRAHWRVPSTTIDAVIAERETLVAAAARVGVQHQTLARWLRDAGIERRKAFVRRSDVDRVVATKRAGKTRAWESRAKTVKQPSHSRRAA